MKRKALAVLLALTLVFVNLNAVTIGIDIPSSNLTEEVKPSETTPQVIDDFEPNDSADCLYGYQSDLIPFSFELSSYVNYKAEIKVDSLEQLPFELSVSLYDEDIEKDDRCQA